MPLHVTILGIDGSGKSTVTNALPAVLAAESRVVTGSAGSTFRVVTPDEDLLTPGFHPDGFPISARLSKHFKRRAKALADDRKWYPVYKLSQMLFQDRAARSLARRYDANIFVSDGNTLLSATGRGGNYRRPASEGTDKRMPVPGAEDLLAILRRVADGVEIPPESIVRLPSLETVDWITPVLRRIGLDPGWLPDMVLFLDLPPEEAFHRIEDRGSKVDVHENVQDLRQAREMYLKTLDAFATYRSPEAVLRLPIEGRSPGEILAAAAAWISARLPDTLADEPGTSAPLGTTGADLSTKGLISKVVSYRYLVHYLAAKWFQGAWREPLFALSSPGRQFLAEGYSARIMCLIYDRREEREGVLNRVFFEHPLHRAVYDRLKILTRSIESELEARLAEGRDLSLFSAPSGFAYDLFEPLESIAARTPGAMQRVRLLAADLDPHGRLMAEVTQRAAKLGVDVRFVRGDLNAPEVRQLFDERAPFDVALFVGLSAWLPKPEMVSHLRWVASRLHENGVLISDAFTPAAYALSGKYAGYKANYYEPSVYQSLMDYCGFDGLQASLESGRDAINHVLLFGRR